ncbi:acyloxyacyl hydrolase [Variovorax sp. WS11]|uniref:acyloxyacyl hydrolase n=1 Tax=Variovorax sp. WS11 TaxID=1105204 RepID=UPI0021590C3A|nr:acyloxyacyl hydrolase [Variovorax sp. WS11]
MRSSPDSRAPYFSNAGIRHPNPGENSIQLRYAYRFRKRGVPTREAVSPASRARDVFDGNSPNSALYRSVK